MWPRRAIALSGLLVGLFGCAAAAGAQDFHIQEVSAARSANLADIKPGTIEFSDHTSPGAIDSETALIRFDEWAEKHPHEKKFLALFPAYTEPTVGKPAHGGTRKSPRSSICTWRKRASFSIRRRHRSIFLVT